jgi:GntR family transcriptional regulator
MRALHLDFSSPTPIWSQIEEGLRRLVACSALAPGRPVPSVRDLAKDLRVNPATVVKAYQRLADAGILTVKRGDGTYVSDKPPVVSRGERDRSLREAASRYAALALSLGANEIDATGHLSAAWRSFERGAFRKEKP